jgi:hypothetical protein
MLVADFGNKFGSAWLVAGCACKKLPAKATPASPPALF